MTDNYFSSLNKLIHLGTHNDQNNIIITDDYEKAILNNKDELIDSQLRVLKNIWTPKITVNEIKTTYNSNILKIGQENKSIHLINKIGINKEQPIVSLDINNTDGIKIPVGSTTERPTTLEKGIIRYNSELDQFEGYGVGNNWGSLGGVIDVNQDTFVRAEKTPGLDNNELEFYTSNQERMIIKDDGKVGIGTSNPRGIFEINDKLLIDEEKIEFNKNLIPNENNTLNIGSSRYKISELFLTKDSIWVDDLHHVIVENGDVKFTKRKTNVVPQSILDLGGTKEGILTFTSKNYLSNINLTEWLDYAQTFDPTIKLKEIFNNEAETKQSVYTWIENNNDIYFNQQYSNIGIGTTQPTVSIDINRTDAIKIPKGTTAERPTTLQKGLIRYNSELDQFEGYGVGDNWGSLGGVIDVNQDTFVRAEKSAGLDNNELEFYTSNQERMIIKDTGKVGINTSDPTHQLHVKGTTRIEGDLIVNGVQHIIDTDTSTTEQLRITNDGTGPALILNQLGSQPVIDIQDSSNSVLFIKDGGNIGIKTNNPNISVHINTTDGIIIPKGTTIERPEYLEKGIIRYNTELEQFEGYGPSNTWGSLGGVMDVDQDTYIRAEKTPGLDNNELEFYTSNQERMIIKSDGKIGIGTNEPSEALEVIGNIKISGLIHNDYFDNKYYTQDHIDINFLGLNYNLNKSIYNSDKDESIIAWYRFDNNYSIGEDSSLSKNDLDLYGSNFYLSDIIKKNGKNSISFNEDYQYLETSKTINAYDYWNTDGFSIAFWTLITDTTSNISLLGIDYDNFAIYYDNKLEIRINGNVLTQQTNITLNENEWNHHTIVFQKNQNNNTNIYYYKDNVKSIIGEDIAILFTNVLNSKYKIGYIENTDVFESHVFKGYLDDIRFYNKFLSDTDVLNVYNDIDVYVKPYTLQSLGQLEMGIDKIPIFLNDTVSGTVDFLNELDLISDSTRAIPTQHSVKTYVDVSASNLYELLRLKPGSITNELLAGNITDDKLYERYVKTSDLINMQTSVDDILQIEHGGTGASNIIDARSNLGLEIGVDVQAYNSRLQSLSDQPGSYNKIPVFSDNNNFKLIDFVDDDEMLLNSCNAIPTQKNIKTCIERVINNFSTDVLKITVKSVNLGDIDTAITIKYNDCIFYITLDLDYQILGASITQQYINFINNIRANLSILLNISTDDITIEDLYLGSIKFKVKVKSTTTRNSAVNINNFYVNYNSLIMECNIDTNLFSNIIIDIDSVVSNQAFDTNKKNIYATLTSDKNYIIDVENIVETPYLNYTIECNIYSNVSYNTLRNDLVLVGSYRDISYDVIVNLSGLTTTDSITLKITEIAPIFDGYAESNMTIVIGNDTKEIDLKEKFIGPKFNLIQLIQTSEYNNLNYINNTLYEITGNFRNTTYDLIWSGTQEIEELLPGQENKTVEWKLTVIELPPIPIKIFSDIDNVFINQVKTYNLNAIFSGISLVYRIITNPYNSAYISGELLFITSDSRGITYKVEVEAKNASKVLNWKVNITENKPEPPSLLITNQNISLADEYYSVELCNVFFGKHLNYDYNVYYNHNLNSNILPNNDFFDINVPWSRYHAKNYNKYMNRLFNVGDNNYDLELVEGTIYEAYDNNIAYIYGDQNTVMKFKMPNTNNYTICALVKYNGPNKGTILGDDTSFIGHWNQIRGFASINNVNLTSISGLSSNEGWLIVLFNNSEESPNNVMFYPTSQDVVSTKTEKKIFDYLYINKQKNSDWALADILIFNKTLTYEENIEIIDIFKKYLLNTNNTLQNYYKLQDISLFLNNFSLDTNSNLVIVDANNIGISYNITLTATNTCNSIDWILTVNEDEYVDKNTDISISTGIYEIGLKYLFNTYNFESNISINTNGMFEIVNDKLILYPKYREIAYMLELNNGESNFIIEVKEEPTQKPKLLNNNYYGVKTGITYLSNIIDNFDNNKTTISIDTINESYYLSGTDMNASYDNVLFHNTLLLEVEQSNIIDISLTNNTFLAKHSDDISINVITDIYNNYILSGNDSLNTIFNNSLSYGNNSKKITVIQDNTLTLNVDTYLPNYTCNVDISLLLDSYNKYSLTGTDAIGIVFNNSQTYSGNVKTVKIIKNTILSLDVNTTTNNPFIIVKSDTNPTRIYNDTNKYTTGVTYPTNNYKTDEGQITGTIIWDTTNSELGTYYGISINTESMYFKIELISSNNLFTILKSNTNPTRTNNDDNKYINSGLVYNGNYITNAGFTNGTITWDTTNSDLGTYYAISPYNTNMYFIIEIIKNNNLFAIVKSDTNPVRTNSDVNKYINDTLVYNGNYEDGYGLINGTINWDTSTSDVGRYYFISTYDSDIYFIIDVISQEPIRYIKELNIFEINNDDITSDLTIYKLLAHNEYGTSLLKIKFVKDTINNNILTQNLINLELASSETKQINLFNYKYANNYSILNNPDPINIFLTNNILTIENTAPSTYDLQVEMDDYVFVFRIIQN
jgi:hypothetical protein